MKAPIDRVRVSQRSRDVLLTMKRRTGIEHWNVLCRWAFLDSLANPNKPVTGANNSEASSIDMTWDVFAGDLADYLLAAFAMRAAKDKIGQTKPEMSAYFRSHLERGILQIQGAGNLAELCKRALQSRRRS